MDLLTFDLLGFWPADGSVGQDAPAPPAPTAGTSGVVKFAMRGIVLAVVIEEMGSRDD